MTGPDLDAMQKSDLPVSGMIDDTHSVTLVDVSKYNRLNEEQKQAFRDELVKTVDAQKWSDPELKDMYKEYSLNKLKYGPLSISATSTPEPQENASMPDTHSWIFVESDKLDPKTQLMQGISGRTNYSPEEKEMFRYFAIEHEKGHAQGFEEAGADYIAATRTLDKYGPKAEKILQQIADDRELATMTVKDSAETGFYTRKTMITYGYECHDAIMGAMSDHAKVAGNADVTQARAHEVDYKAAAAFNDEGVQNGKKLLKDQPEEIVRSRLEEGGHDDLFARQRPEITADQLGRIYDRVLDVQKNNPFPPGSTEAHVLNDMRESLERMLDKPAPQSAPAPAPAAVKPQAA